MELSESIDGDQGQVQVHEYTHVLVALCTRIMGCMKDRHASSERRCGGYMVSYSYFRRRPIWVDYDVQDSTVEYEHSMWRRSMLSVTYGRSMEALVRRASVCGSSSVPYSVKYCTISGNTRGTLIQLKNIIKEDSEMEDCLIRNILSLFTFVQPHVTCLYGRVLVLDDLRGL